MARTGASVGRTSVVDPDIDGAVGKVVLRERREARDRARLGHVALGARHLARPRARVRELVSGVADATGAARRDVDVVAGLDKLAHQRTADAARAAGNDDVERRLGRHPNAHGGGAVGEGEGAAEEESYRAAEPRGIRGTCKMRVLFGAGRGAASRARWARKQRG